MPGLVVAGLPSTGLKNESLANNTPDAWQHYALSGISTSQFRFQLDPIKGKAAGSPPPA